REDLDDVVVFIGSVSLHPDPSRNVQEAHAINGNDTVEYSGGLPVPDGRAYEQLYILHGTVGASEERHDVLIQIVRSPEYASPQVAASSLVRVVCGHGYDIIPPDWIQELTLGLRETENCTVDLAEDTHPLTEPVGTPK